MQLFRPPEVRRQPVTKHYLSVYTYCKQYSIIENNMARCNYTDSCCFLVIMRFFKQSYVHTGAGAHSHVHTNTTFSTESIISTFSRLKYATSEFRVVASIMFLRLLWPLKGPIRRFISSEGDSVVAIVTSSSSFSGPKEMQ